MTNAKVAGFDTAVEAAALRRLADAWMRQPSPDSDLLSAEAVERLAGAERALRSAGLWMAGPASLIEVLGLVHDEVRHCRVLRWLLDPLAPHGIGVEALRRFLAEVAMRAAEFSGSEPPAFPDPADATLVVEEPRADTRADLVISGSGWEVVIEAKIHAAEGRAQGERLADLWPGATYVFLTRGGYAMATAGTATWLPIRWSEVLGHVGSALEDAGEPRHERVRTARRAVQDYLAGMWRLTR